MITPGQPHHRISTQASALGVCSGIRCHSEGHRGENPSVDLEAPRITPAWQQRKPGNRDGEAVVDVD
ncbi:CxxxxCH/CxxCH domain-containing protein [Planomonospora sp. ID82291]|nr:CxxxxCH/CxxCH domain-containing protein [Planomonospora sp. ID82291]